MSLHEEKPQIEPDSEKASSSSVHLDGPDGQDVVKTRQITGVKWFLFIFSVLTALFLYALDNTVVANIQPVIVNHFNSVDELPWLSVGFMIGGLVMVMPLGRLFAYYSNKYLFIFFAVNFMAGSALCGGAPNMPAEIVGRVWAGAGGNGMYYGLVNLISSNCMDQERPTYLSFTGTIWGVGTVIGPVIGGSLAEVGWRWAFWLIVFFSIPLFPAYVFLIPKDHPAPDLKVKEKILAFDWLGAFLSAGFLTLFVVATNFGGLKWRWQSGPIIALYVVSGVMFIAFILQQTFLAKPEQRMFPLHLLRNKEAALCFVLIACGGTMAYVSVFYIPLFFQFTQGVSAVETAAKILPFILLLIFGMLINGFLMSKFGYYKPWYIFGSAIGLAGAAAFSTVTVDTSDSAVYGYQALIGLGAGSFVQAGFSVVQANIDPNDAVHGLTLMMFGQLSGLAGGLSIAGATFINTALKNLEQQFPNVPYETLVQTVSGTSGDFLKQLSPEDKRRALEAIVDALHTPFIQTYAAAALALVLSIFLKWKKVYGVAAGGA